MTVPVLVDGGVTRAAPGRDDVLASVDRQDDGARVGRRRRNESGTRVRSIPHQRDRQDDGARVDGRQRNEKIAQERNNDDITIGERDRKYSISWAV